MFIRGVLKSLSSGDNGTRQLLFRLNGLVPHVDTSYIKLNSDDSAQGNPSLTRAGGVFRDHFNQLGCGFFEESGKD
ncbi:hypothetical protein SLEP1_g30282 [Rubroshorea leprosula]|uniref:Uncharacterized protein n=1 Tax=Rubroshorea leprosula TaxID=152421 RepID=A0AAV5JZK7_9ROSI|nr:hypothetical protein SLEP1_g30282 [Rubroshorea leprosula]